MGDKTPSTPGSQAIENLKTQEQVMQLFKTPTEIVRKKPKPKILTEEKYIEELSNIIQRDFFPDLERLRAQNDYLDAEARKDYIQMEIIRARYSGHRPSERSRSMTPATFETPSSLANGTPLAERVTALGSDTPKSTLSISSKITITDGGHKTIGDKHTLDSFLQAYTSEDNHSFQEIIETAEQKLRQKFAVLYNEERLSAAKLARALTLPSIEKQFEEPDPLRAIETWSYTNKNSVMYIPDGVELTDTERIESANHKQIIKHDATRLDKNPFNDSNQKTVADIVKTQTQVFSEKLGVDGNPLNPHNKPMPQVRGFELVKTPSPRPGEAFSPLMTWGEIEGTPFRLDGSDTPIRSNSGPSFKINETSRRENIALALAEKAGEKMRAQKQRALNAARKNMSSPFIRSNMERLASMSPAARRLATSKLGLRTPSITPTPLRTPLSKTTPVLAKTTPTVGVKKKAHATNSNATRSAAKTTDTEQTPDIDLIKSTLTDDLLKIPTKRLKASDFF